MKAGSGTVGGVVPFAYQLVILCPVRSIDFVTFQSHLNFGSVDNK